jgi:hypothetical protein
MRAAQRAVGALDATLDGLNIASRWAPSSSAVRQVRLNAAQRVAAAADGELAVLDLNLSDVPGMPSLDARLHVWSTSGWADIWITTPFTDLAIRNKIEKYQANVAEARAAVVAAHERLAVRARTNGARLAELDTARRARALGEPTET